MSRLDPIGSRIDIARLDRDPYPLLAELQDKEPISWIADLGMWYVTRWEHVREILLDAEGFTTHSEHSTIFDTFGPQMLSASGDTHRRYKLSTRFAFRPTYVREHLQKTIEVQVGKLIEGFVDQGRTELRTSFASRLPVQIMLQVFGMSASDEPRVRGWYDSFEAALANFAWDEEVRLAARVNVQAFHECLQATIERLRGSPDESLLSALVNAPQEMRLTDDEIRCNALIIFFGGISTVEALILNTAWAVLSQAQIYQRVQQDLTLLPAVIEETVRWHSPVQSATRHVTQSREFHGVNFSAGDIVNCMLGAANRDPRVFDNPQDFDISRPNINKHMGFALGSHHCLGSHLARAEAQIALQQIFMRLPDLRLDSNKPIKPQGSEFHQPQSLPLCWRR